jgi:serine/threonine-protein kinase
VKRGFLEKAVALTALKDQRARAQEKLRRIPFLQLLVQKRILSAQALAEIQDELRRYTYICAACEGRAVLLPSSQSDGASCPRCGAFIAIDSPSAVGEATAPVGEFASGRDLLLAPAGLERFAQGTLAFGRYEVVAEIGRGAMGVVYRARHKTLGKEVALKVLLTGEDARDAQVARFRREASAVQRLKHDGIVPIHDFGVEGELYFLTMELVPGGLTLHKLWKDPERAPDLATRLAHVAQVSRAIDYANRRGVIHRDLKPANVLLTPEGEALVADFGLAKDEEDDMGLTHSEDRLGTPLFMAPEQVRKGSSQVDGRADVWALGVMLFVAATGRYPFRGRTIMDLYMKILNDEPDWTGERSQVPDRDFGQAPKPSEMRSIERLRRTTERRARVLAEGESVSHGDAATTPLAPESPAASRKKTSRERKIAEDPSAPAPPQGPFVPPPDLAGKEVPRDVRLVVEMALAKSPERRYETAGELARDLERFLAGEPVRARPPGRWGRAWRRIKRHRAVLVGALVLALVPSLVALWLHEKKEQEDARARTAALEEERRRADEQARREAEVRKASELAERMWSQVALDERDLSVFKKAASELTRVCDAYPDQPSPLLKRGLAHAFGLERAAAKSDLAQARSLAERVGSLSPGDARTAVSLASIVGDLDAAAALARRGLAQDAKDEVLRLGLARALLGLDQPQDAREALKPLLDAGTEPRGFVLGAEIALVRSDLAAARELSRTAVAKLPDDPEALAVRGLAGVATGEAEAASLLRRARDAREGFGAKGPLEACFFYRMARTLRLDRRAPDPERAALADDIAAALVPWSPVPTFWAADTRFRDLHDVDHALADLDACVARDPTFVEATELRGELLLACRDEAGVARAEKTLRAELARFETDRAHLDLAVLLLGRRDLDGAARELRAATEDETSTPRRELLWAEVDHLAGHEESAAEHRRAFPGKHSGAAARRDLIALARARLLGKDASGALEATGRALAVAESEVRRTGFRNRLPGTSLVAHALEAAAHASLGHVEKALEALGRATSRQGAAAEATPQVLEHTPEFSALRGNPAFARFLESKKGDAADEE